MAFLSPPPPNRLVRDRVDSQYRKFVSYDRRTSSANPLNRQLTPMHAW